MCKNLIRISDEVKFELDKRKRIPMETYDSVLKRVLRLNVPKKELNPVAVAIPIIHHHIAAFMRNNSRKI